MKIQFIEWKSFGNEDIREAFIAEGHTVVSYPFSNKDSRKDEELEKAFAASLHREAPDVVFSFNYFPVISNVCKKENIRYISWIYDSPYVMLYSYTVINPCNTIYVFDKELYLEFHNAGIQTVHYMPMAANTERLDRVLPTDIECSDSGLPTDSKRTGIALPTNSEHMGIALPTNSEHAGIALPTGSERAGITLPADSERAGIALPTGSDTSASSTFPPLPYLYDVSFVGSLYNEAHNFFDRMTTLSDYTKGYLDALMAAQMKVQGYNFIQESLSPIMDDLYKALPMDPNPDGVESREYLYAQYVINRKITGLERVSLIEAVTRHFHFDLFTPNRDFTMPNLTNHGTVDYYKEMPLVFKQSRINLNISLRSIKSGIPLRAFDILGSGGFLLSNYQDDFLDYFIAGEDFVYYESAQDLLNKIDYYLHHEDERAAVARNGYEKVAQDHTFRHRVREMLA